MKKIRKGTVILDLLFNSFPVIIAYKQFLNQLPAAKIRLKAVHSGGLEKRPSRKPVFVLPKEAEKIPFCFPPRFTYLHIYIDVRVWSSCAVFTKQNRLAPNIWPRDVREALVIINVSRRQILM